MGVLATKSGGVGGCRLTLGKSIYIRKKFSFMFFKGVEVQKLILTHFQLELIVDFRKNKTNGGVGYRKWGCWRVLTYIGKKYLH